MSGKNKFGDFVLGAMILNPELIGACRLKQDHFQTKRKRVLFSVLSSIAEHGIKSEELIDHPQFLEQLVNKRPNEDWPEFINQIVNLTPAFDFESFQAYQEAVEKDYRVRQCRKIVEKMDYEQMTYQQIQSKMESAADTLSIDDNSATPLVDDSEIDDFDEYFEERKAMGFQKGILTTGFRKLDDAIMGIRRTDLVILSGEPGKGKTTTALNIMDNIAMDGGTVEMYSLEMPKKNLQHRMIAKEAKVPLNRLYKGGLDSGQIERLKHATKEIKERDISVVTEEENIRGIINSARATLASGDLDLIVIDYLQKLGNHLYNGAGKNEWFEDAVKKIKTFSNRQEVPVILISSLNKDGTAYYTSQSEYECDSHLRLFDPDEVDNPTGATEGAANRILKAQKHRHGPGGAVKLKMDGATSRIWNPNRRSVRNGNQQRR